MMLGKKKWDAGFGYGASNPVFFSSGDMHSHLERLQGEREYFFRGIYRGWGRDAGKS